MFAARQDKEVVVEVFNEIGVLHELAKIVAEKGVSVQAVDAHVEGENAVVRVMTDDNLRTVEALQANRYTPREEPVVVVDLDHKPGVLRHVTERLGKAGINIEHLYVTAALPDEKCLMVLSTSDNERAMVALNE